MTNRSISIHYGHFGITICRDGRPVREYKYPVGPCGPVEIPLVREAAEHAFEQMKANRE